MRLFFCFFVLIITGSLLSAQSPIISKVCEKNYRLYDSLVSDTSAILFDRWDLLIDGGGCSWTCNQHIRMTNKINRTIDTSDSLTNHSISSVCLIDSAVGAEISYSVYLEEYLSNDTIESEGRDAGLFGFLIANGNRKSKQDYFNYARVKRVTIYVNKKKIGFAILKDTPKIQFVYFGDSYPLSPTKKIDVVISIDELYPGNKYKAVAISELKMDGYGGHSITEKFCWQE